MYCKYKDVGPNEIFSVKNRIAINSEYGPVAIDGLDHHVEVTDECVCRTLFLLKDKLFPVLDGIITLKIGDKFIHDNITYIFKGYNDEGFYIGVRHEHTTEFPFSDCVMVERILYGDDGGIGELALTVWNNML